MNDGAPGFHGLKFVDTFGPIAWILRVRVEVLRDLGACMSPFSAQQLLLGVEVSCIVSDHCLLRSMRGMPVLS